MRIAPGVMMRVLFLHGLESKPGGTKARYLQEAGYEVLNPALPKTSFEDSISIAQDVIDDMKPDVVVGSSRGGAVAMSVSTRGAPVVLREPAQVRAQQTAKPPSWQCSLAGN